MQVTNEVEEITYTNPVYPASCADPFVLKYLNEYWCYCTGRWPDGRCFGALHSRDLQHWREVGGALIPYDEAAPCYWAPEVSYENGRFLMYYSVGNEEQMQIRVAAAAHPAGPFTDCGVRLTSEEFAIDPHVFTDHDGARYLFYATDFLTHTHIGTGTVCDQLLDAFHTAGQPRPVTRARYDWQVYDPQRASKGGVRWHTVEGPFVLERKGRYYQMFSGGNWQNASYGASYAVSDQVWRKEGEEAEWKQVADGERVLPVLRTLPALAVGPGHNSAVRGPDNQQLFCVYHFWQPPERVLAIDRLDWVGERLTVLGPTVTPQTAPPPATLSDSFEGDGGLSAHWVCLGGEWRHQNGKAVQLEAAAVAEAQCILRAPHFSLEVSVRHEPPMNERVSGAVGVKLFNEDGAEIAFQLLPDVAQITGIGALGETARVLATLPLPDGFAPAAFHLLRVERNGDWVKFCLDERALCWAGKVKGRLEGCALFTRHTAAAFAGFALTAGWRDLFDEAQTSVAELSWHASDEKNDWYLNDKLLCYDGLQKPPAVLLKKCPAQSYELVINAKLLEAPLAGQSYGFLPASDAASAGPLLTVEWTAAGWVLRCAAADAARDFALGPDFDPLAFQQFRLRKLGAALTVQHEARLLGTVAAPLVADQIGLVVRGARAAFEMVSISVSQITAP